MSKSQSRLVGAADTSKIAQYPPMGWNSWDCYGASVNEEEVIGNADYMAENLLKYGWEYVVIDAQWYEPKANGSVFHAFTELNMDEYSRLIPVTNRFPSAAEGRGFKPLADYIHGKGLKFGIHILRGIPRQAVHANTKIMGTDRRARDIAHPNSICNWITDMYGIDASKEGAREYYDSIFRLYAEWGVDLVKVDDISFPYSKGEIDLVRGAIDRCGRNIVLSLSPGPAPLEEADHLVRTANMWRVSADFWDDWKYLAQSFDYAAAWTDYAGPGHWPDQDMLPLGHIAIRSREDGVGERWTRFTKDEQRTMITLWCMCRSPLFFGGEMRDNDAWTLSLLTNEEALGIQRESRGNRQVFRRNEQVVWAAEGSAGERYLALFNLGEEEQTVEVDLVSAGLEEAYRVKDVWLRQPLGDMQARLELPVPSHGVRLLRLERI